MADHQDGGTELETWRAQLVGTILRTMLVAGAVVAVPSIGYALATGQTAIVVVDVLALLVVAGLTFAPGLRHRTRAIGLVATSYVLGVSLLSTVGLVSQIYLLAVPVFAALLLGLRAAILCLVVNAITLTAVGFVDGLGVHLRDVGVTSGVEWLVITANFLFVNAVLAISCAVLLRRLERSLEQEQHARSTLARQQADLQATNTELERQVVERARAQAQADRLSAAVTRARDAILVTDAEGRVTYANEAAERLRVQAGMDTAWTTLSRLATDRTTLLEIRGTIAQRRSSTLALQWTHDGATHEYDGRISPVVEDDGTLTAFVAVLRDVTIERRTEARVRHADKLEALGTLAGGTAHDFNNVLGSILAVAETARQRTDDPRVQEDLVAIVGACERARDIVRQLMAFGKRSDVGREQIAVRAVVEAALPLLRAALPSTVHIEVALDSDAEVVARPSEIEQVLVNLVTNAAQAMDGHAGGSIAIRLTDRAATSGGDPGHPVTDLVVLSVSDQGPGIGSEHLGRIFDPFFTTKDPTRGSGLGLSSVHGIATSLGGRVDVETELGAGTTFHVVLPAVTPGPHATIGADRDAPPGADDPGPGATDDGTPDRPRATARILLVDDETLLREMAAGALSRAGHEVTTAVDGDVADTLFRSDPDAFDLLVTDLTMPGLDGIGLIERVHELRPGLPVILCSGYGELRGDATIDAAALRGYLPKPFTIADLTASVAAALDGTPDETMTRHRRRTESGR